jgi:hypothetical protein
LNPNPGRSGDSQRPQDARLADEAATPENPRIAAGIRSVRLDIRMDGRPKDGGVLPLVPRQGSVNGANQAAGG